MNLNNLSLFIFRRDLRLDDNTGLISALRNSKSVIPLFILTPMQVSNVNVNKSSNAIQFMMESLIDLDKQIRFYKPTARLWVFYGDEVSVIKKIHNQCPLDGLHLNEDYTPYSIKRDKLIKNFCDGMNIAFYSYTDSLLLDTVEITTNNETYYKVFTQFYKKAVSAVKIRKPDYVIDDNFKPLPIIFKKYNINEMNKFLLKKKFYQINDKIATRGGTTNGLEILHSIKKFKNYDHDRNYPSINTTFLSPHNKFGTVSIREVYLVFKTKAKNLTLCKQLYWRDFYYYVCVHFPIIYKYQPVKSNPIVTYNAVWDNNMRWFKKWTEARTGFPIVDAGMRQLNETGFMHNRCRMICAMFLTKDLLINWKFGEKYFTKKLIDIDRCQNIGNWNWSSSFGLDNSSFIRIFNPWTQSSDYDPDCIYIKKWIPELKDITNDHIHRWDKYHNQYPKINYPKPMIDHGIRRTKFLDFYKKYM